MNFPSCKVVDLTIAGTTENQKAAKQDLSIRNRRKLSASGAPESVGLHGCSILHDGASKKSKPCLEKEQLSSSCGSVPIKPCLTELHGPSQNMEANSVSLKESVGVNRRTLAENSKYSNAKYKDSCSSKVILNLFYYRLQNLF